MDIEDLVSSVGEWLRAGGAESDIVISTRVRLARNVDGFPFPARATPQDRQQIAELLTARIRKSGILGEGLYLDLAQASDVDRQLLVERHLISKEHAQTEGERLVAFGRTEMASIMVNEEDHLRIQVIHHGLDLQGAWSECDRIEGTLARFIEFAFHEEFGYLTACPTNVGTGLRVSIMLHLPALVMTKQIEKVFESLSRMNLAVRGLYGEGTSASGDFYQISNQVTLGRSEEETIARVGHVVPQILAYERKVRRSLVSENKTGVEDRVWRALGTLRSARTITTEETMQFLSAVRMGVNLGLISDVPIDTINELFVMTQPAHLQKLQGRALPENDRDVLRASFIRRRLDFQRS